MTATMYSDVEVGFFFKYINIYETRMMITIIQLNCYLKKTLIM